jgi:hypothetical protein
VRGINTDTEEVRRLFAAYELGEDKLHEHIKPRRTRARFLEFCRYLRCRYPLPSPITVACDNFSPHLTAGRYLRHSSMRSRVSLI